MRAGVHGNAITAAAGAARNFKAIQVDRNSGGVDANAVGLGHAKVTGEKVGTWLTDDEMIIRVARRVRRVQGNASRSNLVQRLHGRRRCAGRSERTLRKNPDSRRQPD